MQAQQFCYREIIPTNRDAVDLMQIQETHIRAEAQVPKLRKALANSILT
jgi:hypothetical protein